MTTRLLAFAIFAAAACAQEFEVASIKRCTAGRVAGTPLLDITPGRLTANCVPVSFLIETAYYTYAANEANKSWRMTVQGGPTWLRSEFYQVNAKAEDPAASAAMMGGAMLRHLLETRLQLKTHQTTEEVAVYAVTMGEDDAKLRGHVAQPCSPCAGIKASRSGTRTVITAEGVSLDDLYRLQGIAANRPVVNRTGVTGSYTFRLEFEPERPQAAAPTTEPIGPSLFDALETELGLKLGDSKAPAARILVDSIERPSDN
jgi:uncharacterized protein (TIGR03435 family)